MNPKPPLLSGRELVKIFKKSLKNTFNAERPSDFGVSR